MFSRSDGRLLIALALVGWGVAGWGVLTAPTPGELRSGLGISLEENKPVPVDLNGASIGELVALPGIGPVLAERIVRHRLVHGPFRSIEDLASVPDIGPRRLEALRPFLYVCPTLACD